MPSDRDILFGVLALQMRLLTPRDFADAYAALATALGEGPDSADTGGNGQPDDPTSRDGFKPAPGTEVPGANVRTLPTILRQREALTIEQCRIVDEAVEAHLKRADGDARRTLVAIGVRATEVVQAIESASGRPDASKLNQIEAASNPGTVLALGPSVGDVPATMMVSASSRRASVIPSENHSAERGEEETAAPSHKDSSAEPLVLATQQAARRSESSLSRKLDSHRLAPGMLGSKARLHVRPADRYDIKGEHARGGLARILLAADNEVGRVVAMKVLLNDPNVPGTEGPQSAYDEGSTQATLERFLAEARITARLEHPAIVPVHEIGLREDGQVYYTMPLIRGESLHSILERLRHKDAETQAEWTQMRLLGVFQKVCQALAFAHTEGVIHRDLKPDNIMVGRFGQVFLVDWGLAKIPGAKDRKDTISKVRVKIGEDESETVSPIEEAKPADADVKAAPTPTSEPVAAIADSASSDDSRAAAAGSDPDATMAAAHDRLDATIPNPQNTVEGEVLGTPSYMPPEQARGNISLVDTISDIYSLGATLYEILTHRPPYEGDNPWAVVGRVLAGPPPNPASRAPEQFISRELEAICVKAMARERDKRYQSADLLEKDIQAAMEGRAVSALPDNILMAATRLIKRHKGIALVATAAIVLLCVGASIFAWVSRGQAETRLQLTEQAQVAMASEQAAMTRQLEAEQEKRIALEQREDLIHQLSKETDKRASLMRILDRRLAGAPNRVLMVELRDLLMKYPDFVEAKQEIAWCFIMLGWARQAEKLLGSILEDWSLSAYNKARASTALGSLLMFNLDDPVRAAAYYDQAIAADAANPYSLAAAAMLRLDDDADIAVNRASSALVQAPNLWEAHYVLGQVGLTRADSESALRDALDHLDAVCRLRPDLAVGFALRGEALYRLGEFDRAELDLARCLDVEPEHIEATANLARVLVAKNDDQRALGPLTTVLNARPLDTEMLLLRAIANDRTGRAPAALDDAERALALGHDDADVYAIIARAAEATGDLDRALSANQRVLDLDPDRVSAYFATAGLLVALSRRNEAVDVYTALLARQPQQTDVRRELARLLVAIGRHDDAVAQWRVLTDTPRSSAEDHEGLGLALEARGGGTDALDALDAFNQAIAMDATVADYYFHAGRTQAALGYHDEARQSFNNAIARRGDRAAYFHHRALTFRALGDLDAAASDLFAATALAPANVAAWEARLDLALTVGDLESAIAHADRLVRAAARRDEVRYLAMRADVYRRLQRYDDARADCDNAAALDGDDPTLLRARGLLARTERRFAAAEQDFARLAAVQPRNVDAHCLLGQTLLVRGRVGDARNAFDQAVALAPDDVEVRCQLARFYWAIGRADLGAEVLLTARGLAQAGNDARPDLAEADCWLMPSQPDLTKAVAALERAVAIAPNDVNLRTQLADTYGRAGNAPAAFTQLREAMALQPRAVSVYPIATRFYLTRGEFYWALHGAGSGLALNPNQPLLLLYRAFAQFMLGSSADAARDVDNAARALAPWDEHGAAWLFAVRAAQAIVAGEVDRADAALERASAYWSVMRPRELARWAAAYDELSTKSGVRPAGLANTITELWALSGDWDAWQAATARARQLVVAVEPRATGLEQALAQLDAVGSHSLSDARRAVERAAVLAQGGRVDDAITALRNAISLGYKLRAVLETDPLLEPLRERDDFKSLMAELPAWSALVGE